MTRQTFLSRDFFVPAPEKASREVILRLPPHVPYLSFLSENYLLQSIRFLLAPAQEKRQYLVEVLWLPLNLDYTKITLRCSYLDGGVLTEVRPVGNILNQLEAVLMAIVEGKSGDCLVPFPEPQNNNLVERFMEASASLSVFALYWRKFF